MFPFEKPINPSQIALKSICRHNLQMPSPLYFSKLPLLVQLINGYVDRGEHDSITIEEVKPHLEDGDLFDWMEERLGEGFDPFYSEERTTITQKLWDIAQGFEGRESRQLLVEHKGLCYLLALTFYLLQFTPEQSERVAR